MLKINIKEEYKEQIFDNNRNLVLNIKIPELEITFDPNEQEEDDAPDVIDKNAYCSVSDNKKMIVNILAIFSGIMSLITLIFILVAVIKKS